MGFGGGISLTGGDMLSFGGEGKANCSRGKFGMAEG